MLLTAARVLAEHQDELKCTVKLIFQPAEELTNGAVKVLESGKVGKAGYGGGHAHIPVPGERHHLRGSGPRYTSASFMNIKIIGKSGHGAMPQYAVDPIYVGGKKVVDALQSIANRGDQPHGYGGGQHLYLPFRYHGQCFLPRRLSSAVRCFNPKLRRNCRV